MKLKELLAKITPLPWVFAYGSIYRADTLHDESSIRIALMDRNEAHTMPVERDSNAAYMSHAASVLPEVHNALWIAEATIVRLERHAPGTAGATLEIVHKALAKAEEVQ